MYSWFEIEYILYCAMYDKKTEIHFGDIVLSVVN